MLEATVLSQDASLRHLKMPRTRPHTAFCHMVDTSQIWCMPLEDWHTEAKPSNGSGRLLESSIARMPVHDRTLSTNAGYCTLVSVHSNVVVSRQT